MRQAWALFLAVILVACFTAAAQGATATPSAQASRMITTQATIESVDVQNRMVTLKGPQGNTFAVRVGPGVKDLSALKPGDQVMAKYYESVAVKMAKPGQPPIVSEREVEKTMPGQPATRVRQVTTTATVESIDKDKSEVTLKGPRGKTVTVQAMNPSALESLKEGDRLNITYTEAMAVSLEKAMG